MSRVALPALLLTAAFGAGCETHYSDLRFRPVDTTSQRTVEGVTLIVNGHDRAVTDAHGIAYLKDLHAGDSILLTKPGYQPTRLDLRMGQYTQHAPAADPRSADNFTLHDLDAVPVPLHRDTAIRRP